MISTSPLAPLCFILLAFLSTLTLASPDVTVIRRPVAVQARQQGQATSLNDARCIDYSNIANVAIVGGNSTYRTAFLQLSREGALANQVMFSTAQLALPPLTIDVALNTQCGNQTERAAAEVIANFTSGQVLGLRGVETLDSPPGAVQGAGMSLLAIVGVICFVFIGVWGFMP